MNGQMPYGYQDVYSQNGVPGNINPLYQYGQMQMQTQTTQRNNQNMIMGRIVEKPEDVMPNEVSMDGRVAVFPVKDYSCIYAKAWNNDGTITTVKYIPEPPPVDPKESADSLCVNEDFQNEIFTRLDKIEKMLAKQRYRNYKPKEAQNEHS